MSWWKDFKAPVITDKIYGYLRALYEPPQWAWYGEFKAGVGYSKSSMSYFDAMAINTWAKKQHVIGYEIKASRQDFTKELKNHDKRANIERICNEVWFAVPSGLVKEDEIPEGWGLIELMSNGKFKRVKHPRYHEVTWDWRTIVSMAKRSIDDTHKNHDKQFWRWHGQDIGREELDKIVKERYSHHLKHAGSINKNEVIREFTSSKEYQDKEDFIRTVSSLCKINKYRGKYNFENKTMSDKFKEWHSKNINTVIPVKYEHAIDQVLNNLKRISDDAKEERYARARSKDMQPVYKEEELS